MKKIFTLQNEKSLLKLSYADLTATLKYEIDRILAESVLFVK